MALPTIPGSSISLNQVNVELGLSGTATITMNDAAVRTLFGKAGSGTTISMSDGSGKSNFTVAYSSANGYAALANNDVIFGAACYNFGFGDTGLNFKTNGQVDWFLGNLAFTELFNTWGNPTTTGVGSNYWIRFTKTAESGSLEEATASTGWLQLSTNRPVSVMGYNGGSGSATYTIEIAGGSGGTPLLSTRTGIVLEIFNECGGG